jgi:hypothetical protein
LGAQKPATIPHTPESHAPVQQSLPLAQVWPSFRQPARAVPQVPPTQLALQHSSPVPQRCPSGAQTNPAVLPGPPGWPGTMWF